MKLWFQKSPFFGLLKRNSSAQLKKRKTKKICRKLPPQQLSCSGSSASQGQKRCPSPRVSVSLHPPLSTIDTPIRTLEGSMRPDPRPATQKKGAKDAKEAPCKLVKLSNKVWNTSLKNISFQLDHPELLETIMFEPRATCMKKTRLKYDQLHDLHHANSNFNSAFRGVMFASDFDMKIHFTWTALCLTVCIEVKFSAHFAFVCCKSWICLCKVRSSLEVGHLCSKSKDSDNVRLRDFSSQNERNRGIWSSVWWFPTFWIGFGSAKVDDTCILTSWFLTNTRHLVSVAPSTWPCCRTNHPPWFCTLHNFADQYWLQACPRLVYSLQPSNR